MLKYIPNHTVWWRNPDVHSCSRTKRFSFSLSMVRTSEVLTGKRQYPNKLTIAVQVQWTVWHLGQKLWTLSWFFVPTVEVKQENMRVVLTVFSNSLLEVNKLISQEFKIFLNNVFSPTKLSILLFFRISHCATFLIWALVTVFYSLMLFREVPPFHL